MVAYSAAVHLQHPYGILLALVQVRYAQAFQIEVGKLLMRAVIIRAHETVEQGIVSVRQLFLEGVGLSSEPVGELAAYLLDFGVGILRGNTVPDLDGGRLSGYGSMTDLLLVMSGMVLCRACRIRAIPS